MNSRDKQLSKSLSWLLRHGAEKEGLELSEEGYVDIEKILALKAFKQYDALDIERVVKNNDKQRFRLRLNPCNRTVEVKATQGHSILTVTDIDLTPILEPKYEVVHGTYNHCWPNIRQSGLSRMRRRHVHLAKGIHNVTSGLRVNAQIHVFINLRKALEDGLKFFESENGVVLTPGNDKGFLEPKYFDRVVEVATGESNPVPLRSSMSGGPVIPARVPSRPTTSRPPFPSPHTAMPSHMHPPPPRGFPAVATSSLAPAPPPPHAHRPVVHMPLHTCAPAPASAPAPRVAAAQGARAARSADNWRRRNNNNGNNNPPRAPPEPDIPLPNAVIVSGYPPYTKPQDLAHAFCKFGSVRFNHEWITDTEALLEFGEPGAAAAAVGASRALNLYGAFLTVRPATTRTRPQRQHKKREHRIKQNFKGISVDPASIPLSGAFPQQLEAVLRAVRLSQPEIERLATLYRDIELALRELWPGCCAIPFGSVTTGLGVKSSDADCFVSLPRGALGGTAGAVPRARRALHLHPQVFGSILAIPRANTPIVKFQHIPTGVYCDLSFKTALGARNSKLISFLLFSDPRLIPVAVVIKYWARVHDLTGTGKLTNYALTMLIIFYLQQAPIPILPSVESLQKNRSDDYIVDYWNTGFMSDHRRLPPSNNTASIAELLGGFFEFYAKFDFDQLVVCPYLGRPIKKDDFRDLNLLPNELDRYKTNVASGVAMPLRFMTPVCVQDPFEQCHNVASPVSARLLGDIRAYLLFAAAAHAREQPAACAGLLRTILLKKPDLPRNKGKSVFRARLPQGIVANISAPDWKAVVRSLGLQIFETILRVPLSKLDEVESQQAKGKPAGISKKEREWYEGAITRAIWKRKQFSKLYSVMGLKLLDRETMITDEIMKIDKNVIEVRFQMTLTFQNAPRGAVVALKHADGELNFFKEFGKFFNSTFQHWFVVLYKPYCRKDGKKPEETVKSEVTEEEAAAKELREVMKTDGEEESDSDSDTDSFEDERINPDALPDPESKANAQNDSLKVQNDTDNKNTKNNTIKKRSETEKTKKLDINLANDVNENSAPAEENSKDEPKRDKSPRKKDRLRDKKKAKPKNDKILSPRHKNKPASSVEATSADAAGPLPTS